MSCVLDLGNVQDTIKFLIPQEMYRKFHVSLLGIVHEMGNSDITGNVQEMSCFLVT